MSLRINEIYNLDLEKINLTKDFSVFDPLIENLIFGKIEINTNFNSEAIKIVNLFQESLEHLFYLEEGVKKEIVDYEQIQSSNLQISNEKDNILKENKNYIRALQANMRDKEMRLKAYKSIVDEKSLKRSISVINKNNKSKISKYFYCNFCEMRRFTKEDLLFAHISRRHLKDKNDENLNKYTFNSNIFQNKTNYLSASVPLNDQSIQAHQILSYFKEIKDDLAMSLNNFHKENFVSLTTNQLNLEKKIEELKFSTTNNFHSISNFNNSQLQDLNKQAETISNEIKVELKSEIKVLENNFQNLAEEIKYISTNNIEKQENYMQGQIKTIENESRKMKDIVNDISQNQKEQIERVLNELAEFKKEKQNNKEINPSKVFSASFKKKILLVKQNINSINLVGSTSEVQKNITNKVSNKSASKSVTISNKIYYDSSYTSKKDESHDLNLPGPETIKNEDENMPEGQRETENNLGDLQMSQSSLKPREESKTTAKPNEKLFNVFEYYVKRDSEFFNANFEDWEEKYPTIKPKKISAKFSEKIIEEKVKELSLDREEKHSIIINTLLKNAIKLSKTKEYYPTYFDNIMQILDIKEMINDLDKYIRKDIYLDSKDIENMLDSKESSITNVNNILEEIESERSKDFQKKETAKFNNQMPETFRPHSEFDY